MQKEKANICAELSSFWRKKDIDRKDHKRRSEAKKGWRERENSERQNQTDEAENAERMKKGMGKSF